MEIIHVDMDAFFAAVEARDNPELAGKPLIVGALPGERGVVSTCSYEARKFGVRSAMSVTEAYRLCPKGIYVRPNPEKYYKVSEIIHEIWLSYTDIAEFISLDEGFLDVTASSHLFGGAEKIAREIKERVKAKTKLTCSVGIGYSLMSAKLASEEKKPDGLFIIPNAQFLRELIIDRGVRIIYGVGEKTAEHLKSMGIHTVRDIYNNRQRVINALGSQGEEILRLADGADGRTVMPYTEAKSIGKEHTFQKDTLDFDYLKDCLRLIAKELSLEIRLKGIYAQTVTLKVKYADMKLITRSKSGEPENRSDAIYRTAAALLDNVIKRPVRLIGISLGNLGGEAFHQLDFDSMKSVNEDKQREKLDGALLNIQKKYGGNIIKTANELGAEKRIKKKSET